MSNHFSLVRENTDIRTLMWISPSLENSDLGLVLNQYLICITATTLKITPTMQMKSTNINYDQQDSLKLIQT